MSGLSPPFRNILLVLGLKIDEVVYTIVPPERGRRRRQGGRAVHQAIDTDDEPLFRACEEIFLDYGGRPHWGKLNYLSAEQFANLYPRWNDWWKQRDAVDPSGRFLNDWLRSIRP